MKLPFDLGIALILGTFAGLLTYLAYLEVGGTSPDLYLELGDAQSYRINQNGVCVGFVRSEMLHEDLREFKVEGAMYLQCATPPCSNRAAFEIRSFFNPLGQLFQARGGLIFEKTSFTLTLLDASPHRVELEMDSPTAKYRQNFIIPGPITLSADRSRQSHTVDFSVLGNFVSSGTTPVLSFGERTLGLAVVPVEEIPEQCKGEGTISLAPLVGEIMNLRNRLQGMAK
jgi:hypothetical protein